MTLVRVWLPYACYGLLCRNGVVVQAPPIARWMVGRDVRFCAEWVGRKGGTTEMLS